MHVVPTDRAVVLASQLAAHPGAIHPLPADEENPEQVGKKTIHYLHALPLPELQALLDGAKRELHNAMQTPIQKRGMPDDLIADWRNAWEWLKFLQHITMDDDTVPAGNDLQHCCNKNPDHYEYIQRLEDLIELTRQMLEEKFHVKL